MKWFKVLIHDYMDMSPEVSYRLFEDWNQAKAWEKQMRENWASGTTNVVGYATQQEILDYIQRYNLQLDEATRNNINNKQYYHEQSV